MQNLFDALNDDQKHDSWCNNKDHIKSAVCPLNSSIQLEPILIPSDQPEVITILQQCIDIYRMKASDYNHPTKHTTDPLSNFRTSEELSVPAYLGALVRMSDKWERIKTLVYKMQTTGEGPAVKDESIEDTLKDIINYGAIVLALYRQDKNKNG